MKYEYGRKKCRLLVQRMSLALEFLAIVHSDEGKSGWPILAYGNFCQQKHLKKVNHLQVIRVCQNK